MLDNQGYYFIARTLFAIFETSQEIFQQLVYYSNNTYLLPPVSGYSTKQVEQFVNLTLPCATETISSGNGYGFKKSKIADNIWEICFKETCPLSLNENVDAYVNWIMLTIGWTVLVIGTFCVVRRKSACTSCCGGRPGPVVPLNMLDSYENRFGYSAALGLTSSSCLAAVLGRYGYIVGYEGAQELASYPGYFSTLTRLMLTGVLSTITIPFFIAQNAKNKIYGSVCGIFLSVLWMGLLIYKRWFEADACALRWKFEDLGNASVFQMLSDVPQFLCLTFLLVKFLYTFRVTMKTRIKGGMMAMLQNINDYDWKKEFVYLYVKKIINIKRKDETDGIEIEEDLSFVEKSKKMIKQLAYTHNPDFYYSTRIIMSAVVSCCVVFILAIVFAFLGYLLFIKNLDSFITNPIIDATTSYTGINQQDVKDYVYSIASGWWLGLVLAIIFFILSMINSFTWYRKHVVMLRKGDRSFLPNSIKKGSLEPPSLMASSMKFAGFQVAYSIWGFLIMFVILWIIAVLIITQLFLPIKRNELSFGLQLIIDFWPSLLVAVVIAVAQNLSSTYLFLIDKEMSVNNRRAYHIVSYFMFYFNIFLGIASCLLRIIFGLLFGVIFLQRLSKSTLPRSYEKRDPGYLAYVGFLLLEHQHANPVLQCFVQLLLESYQENKDLGKFHEDIEELIMQEEGINTKEENRSYKGDQGETSEISEIERAEKAIKSMRIRNKWQVYKMLVLNPTLLKYRAKPVKKVFSKKIATALLGFSQVAINDLVTSSDQNNKDENHQCLHLNGLRKKCHIVPIDMADDIQDEDSDIILEEKIPETEFKEVENSSEQVDTKNKFNDEKNIEDPGLQNKNLDQKVTETIHEETVSDDIAENKIILEGTPKEDSPLMNFLDYDSNYKSDVGNSEVTDEKVDIVTSNSERDVLNIERDIDVTNKQDDFNISLSIEGDHKNQVGNISPRNRSIENDYQITEL